jgi:hypothetical protein
MKKTNRNIGAKKMSKKSEEANFLWIRSTILVTVLTIIGSYIYNYYYILNHGSSATTHLTSYDFIEEELEWDNSNSFLMTTQNFLSSYVCKDSKGYCHALLKAAPQRRTHYVAPTRNNSTMKKGETVMVLPRHLLIWDLDAMRDEFVQNELFHARHSITGNPLDSGAFLAAHLVQRKNHIGQKQQKKYETKDLVKEEEDDDERFLEFLNMLPKYNDLIQSHPLLWPMDQVESLFGRQTPVVNLIEAHKRMIASEYDAFRTVSKVFQEHISEMEYVIMRINVISRSFGPGPPGPEEELEKGMTLSDELNMFYSKAGIDFKKGCRAMSPILDMWDHHAAPNVEWRYERDSRAFVIRVARDEIPALQDIMVSYGKYTDSHLFAKFGFVNGDGSGHTEASIAIMHPLLDYGMGQQFSYMKRTEISYEPTEHQMEESKKMMFNYLRFDDGYTYCIDKALHPEAYQLKLLKYKHLIRIANKYDRWTLSIGPRNSNSTPASSSNIPITSEPPQFDSKSVKFNGMKLISTCRLIALSIDDYDGNAINVLTEALRDDKDFFVEKQSDQLEFRALTTLARLTSGALHMYPSSVEKDMTSLASFSFEFQSKEWAAAHVRLGEMQSLEVLRSVATSGAKEMRRRVKAAGLDENGRDMFIHSKTCPAELTSQLMEDL